MKTYIM